ncbi:MAG TPA: hypothetical protein VF753_12930 [Terriglobales bacterium]
MMRLRTFGAVCFILLAGLSVHAQTWTALKNQPTFMTGGAGPGLLLTDGTVLVHDACGTDWWKLTPDNTGSYVNGTWSQVASLQSGYAPVYFASAVLPDGRVMIQGGEYNVNCVNPVWTNQGAIYDPVKNKWTKVNPPTGWTSIGDSQSVVLPDGTFMLANCCESAPYPVAYLDATNLTYSLHGSGKQDRYDEEGWVLLDSGNVLTTDAINSPDAEQYDPSTEKWTSAGTACQLEDSSTQEIGPMVMRPDGTVFATGAEDVNTGTAHTCTYTPPAKVGQPGTWADGPDIPNKDTCEDAPGALEPNGRALIMASPGVFNPPAHFYEWDGTQFFKIAGPPNAKHDPSYAGNFLELPTGQLLFMDYSDDVEVFTPKGRFQNAWRPAITSVEKTLTHGETYKISGTQFNGLSQGAFYGDDAQMATNYALVRITNTATGHVFFARTHDPSTMGIATGSTIVSTNFDVPAKIETGPSKIAVVTNGIPSIQLNVTVQ